ncbi:MAG TPA: AAA family ATPase [Candidatus Angelobacter sp.]|nr:AAA family ATPase [Candidatus Angelobacter sp.]
MSTLAQQFRAARRVSTPLICVRTPDPAATIATLCTCVAEDAPRLQWDIGRGLRAINAPGSDMPSDASTQAIASITSDPDELQAIDPSALLARAENLPKSTLLFFLNPQLFLDSPAVIQGIWNLRDTFKSNRRTLVMLCPSMTLPPELSQDVFVLDEPLPTPEELGAIITEAYTAAAAKYDKLPPLADATRAKAVDATCGLAAFPAEQVIAMSLGPTGIDLNGLWERKRTTIEQTPGLSVWRGGETFDDLEGLANVKKFLGSMLTGKQPPRAIVWLDEIEKGMAGATASTQETSGTAQEMLGTLLGWMQDHRARGMLSVGVAGGGKSAVAKAAGNTANISTIKFDISAMKGSYIGESGRNLRQALEVVRAISQGQTFFIATCNKIADLPPELRRRFKSGTFFFDLPTAEERAAIWPIYLKKYELSPRKDDMPNDTDWTGAEIEQCCELSFLLDCTPKEAAAYIVPVSKSASQQIEKLRIEATGRYISASRPGFYQYVKAREAAASGREISLEG